VLTVDRWRQVLERVAARAPVRLVAPEQARVAAQVQVAAAAAAAAQAQAAVRTAAEAALRLRKRQ